MRGSHAKARRRALAVGLGLTLLSGVPALAQLGPPVELTPPPLPAAVAPPGPAARFVVPGDDIEAEPLAPLDSSWAGTLGPADGALPNNLWAGTPRGFVDAALPLLGPSRSPALQALARRLLLSDARAPAGHDQPDHPTLLALRLHRLLALGLVDGGVQLLNNLTLPNASEAMQRDGIELRFAANDIDGACKTVRGLVGTYQNVWWERALIACQALSGQYDAAGLGLGLMRERKAARDAAFEALIDTIDGHRARLEALPDSTPMRLALLAAAKLPLPAGALAQAGPAALYFWAINDKVPAPQRLEAAEKAAAYGALPPASLGLVYGAMPFTPAERAGVLKGGKPPEGARGRALLYDAASTAPDGPSRAAALQKLLTAAPGELVSLARLVAPLVTELTPGPALRGFAGDATRLLLAARQPEAARPWIALAPSPQLRLLDQWARGQAGEPVLRAALADLATRDTPTTARQASLLATLDAALGGKTGPLDQTALLTPPHSGTLPDAMLWDDQIQAAAAGRLGETVLASLLLGTAGDRLTPEPIVLGRLVAGLKAVGLDADARALSVEAALDAGL